MFTVSHQQLLPQQCAGLHCSQAVKERACSASITELVLERGQRNEVFVGVPVFDIRTHLSHICEHNAVRSGYCTAAVAAAVTDKCQRLHQAWPIGGFVFWVVQMLDCECTERSQCYVCADLATR
jgi:hypothetical protein